MGKFMERRRCRRFEIPNAKVKYKKTGLFGFLSRFSTECPMLNMSKGGLAFLSETTFRNRQIILVQLLLPNESPVVLIGRVIWQTDRNFVNEAMTGIEFLPFGSRRGFNPIAALRVLQRIDSQYGEGSGDK